MKGRPPKMVRNHLIYEIVSIWKKKGEILTLSDIHREFVKLGIISNESHKSNTSRILRRLINEGIIERVDRGRYRLRISPRPFQLIKTIMELEEKYRNNMIYEWRVGGIFSTLAEGLILGAPNDIYENPVNRVILNILLVRLAHIFNAIVELITISKLFKGQRNKPISYLATREFVLNILPHIIGEQSGIDFDGLPADDIVELYTQLLNNMPTEINGQPIFKELIEKYIRIANEMLENSIDMFTLQHVYMHTDRYDLNEYIEELMKIIMVIHPSREILVKDIEEERKLFTILKEGIENGESEASLFTYILYFNSETVTRVLNYLTNFFKRYKSEEVPKIKNLEELYHLSISGRILDSVIYYYLHFKEKGTLEENISKLKKEIKSALTRGYSLKEMIMGLWFSNWTRGRYPFFSKLIDSKDDKSALVTIREVLQEAFKALNIKMSPDDIEKHLKEGYDTAIKLEKQRVEDLKKISRRLEEFLDNNKDE